MKLKKWPFLITLFGIGIYVLWKTEKADNSLTESQSDGLELVVQEVGNDEGWMYSIYDRDVLLIRQQFLPILKGQQKIFSRDVAEQLGNIVIEKIRNQKMPAITKEELERIIPADLKKDSIH